MKFISQLPQLRQEVGQKLWEQVANNINNSLSQQSYDNLFTPAQQQKLVSGISQIASNIIASNSEISTIVQEGSSRQTGVYASNTDKQKIKNLSQNLQALLVQYLETDVVRQNLYAIYQTAFNITSRQSRPTTNALYGMLRRELITQVLSNNSAAIFAQRISGYIHTFKGDLAEIWGTKGIEQYLHDAARRAGQVKHESKETPYDIIIGSNASKMSTDRLQKLVDKLMVFNKTVTLDTQVLSYDFNYFGGQVKSWYPPGVETNSSRVNTSYLSIGTRTDIFQKYNFGRSDSTFYRGWHYSAEVLGKEILRVLGASNVFYITGGKFIWTDDLIQSFKQARYYLTFYYHRKASEDTNDHYAYQYPGTADVVWAQQKLKLYRRVKKT